MKVRPWVLGLVLLMVVDVLLVAWAMGLGVFGADPAGESAGAAMTSTSTTSEPSNASRASSGEPGVGPFPLVEAVDADRALHATHVPCETEGGSRTTEIERTTDGGETWTASEVPGRSVLRLRLTSPTQGFAVIADQECRPAIVTTGDGGQTWGEPGPATSTWGLWPEGGGRVLVPSGEAEQACEEGDVRSISARAVQTAVVLCDGGSVRLTHDAGQTWTAADDVEGAIALAVDEATIAVLVTSPDCDGLGVRSGLLGEELDLESEIACVKGVSAPAAISVAGDWGWVVDEERTATSPDLRSWAVSAR